MICHRLCPRLSPRGSFGESRRNGIWAIPLSIIQAHFCAVFEARHNAVTTFHPYDLQQMLAACMLFSSLLLRCECGGDKARASVAELSPGWS